MTWRILITAMLALSLAGCATTMADPLDQPERAQACGLVKAAVTDASATPGWHIGAVNFLRYACSDEASARLAIDKICAIAQQDGLGLPRECKR